MRVLIVGCGYVGLPLGADLAREGHEVFGLRRSTGAESELRAARIQPVYADITRPEELARFPGSLDWVVNCVASAGGSAEEYRRVYREGTSHLLKRLLPERLKKFVYTSSTSVYGQDDGSQVTETSPARPNAESAQVLVETEQLLLETALRDQFPAVILRVAGIYGPGRGHWFKQFLKHEARIEGKGDRILNMIHRDDVVGCITAALRRGKPGEIYNAADDEPVSQLDFFKWLAGAVGEGLPPYAPDDPRVRKRGATNKRVANHKLKAELGYQFKYPNFREGYGAELQRLARTGESDFEHGESHRRT
jgi:nucleoside-diphosphate-sugar epimerase